MRKYFLALALAATAPLGSLLLAQGPPITLDKPIMLGEKKGVLRPYLKFADNERRDFTALVLEGDYNVSNAFAVGAELPLVYDRIGGTGLGDLSLMGKYQFFRRDGMGKTVRIAAKAKQTFATGRDAETMTLGMGHAMTYVGVLAARESLALGTQFELGYGFVPSNRRLSQLNYKLGFGLPLLEPTYPVKQVNLYFETEAIHLRDFDGAAQYGFYYAQGLQYARGRYTFDLSVQLPVAQQLDGSPGMARRLTILAGIRVIL